MQQLFVTQSWPFHQLASSYILIGEVTPIKTLEANKDM